MDLSAADSFRAEPKQPEDFDFGDEDLSQWRKKRRLAPALKIARGFQSVRENFQASLRDARSAPLYPALKAPGYSQTPLRGANPARSPTPRIDNAVLTHTL